MPAASLEEMPLAISDRVRHIESHAIDWTDHWGAGVPVFAQPDNLIADLSFGNPRTMAPDKIWQPMQRSVKPTSSGHFAYKTHVPETREAVARYMTTLNSQTPLQPRPVEHPFDPQDIMMTTGAVAALNACTCLAGPGDEVIYLSPPWFGYGTNVAASGARAVVIPFDPTSFVLPVAEVSRALTKNTKLVLINGPHNPSGRVFTAQEQQALADVLSAASRRFGHAILLVSDEAYRDIVFDDAPPFLSPVRFYPHTLVVYTSGKKLLNPGARIGYIALSPLIPVNQRIRLRTALHSLLSLTWSFPNAVLQYTFPSWLATSFDCSDLKSKRDMLCHQLTLIGYEVLIKPQATFYLMVHSPCSDVRWFVMELFNRGVVVLGGWVFGLEGCFRLCLTETTEKCQAALPVFREVFKQAKLRQQTQPKVAKVARL